MNAIPESYRKEIDALPPLLRALLDAELAAGNQIADVRHGFPAAPIGACVMLARAVTTTPRTTGNGLKFRERKGSDYSGEFTDSAQLFYIIEPPLPAEPEPDMDAIRAAHASSALPHPESSLGSAVLDRFRKSMTIDYEKWHDGIGFDLDVLREATETDKKILVSMLSSVNGWREVEALAALDTDAAKMALRKAMKSGNMEVRTAVTQYAPQVLNDDERTAALVNALEHGVLFGGLSSALDQVADYHPQPIVDALFRGLFVRPGDVACHYAAMLAYVHGKAKTTFDWNKRPLFLRFNSDDGAERRKAFPDLCKLLKLDPEQVLKSIGADSL